MAEKLGDVIGAMLADVAKARVRADVEALRIAEAYSRDPLLKHLSVPRFRLPDMVVDLPVLVSGVDASASVLFDGTSYRLMVASTGTGTAAAAHFTDSGDSLGLSSAANIKVPAQDAIATIDGVDVTRGTNVIDDAVAGVTFTLVSPHAVSDASAQVTVALDSDTLKSKLASFVSAAAHTCRRHSSCGTGTPAVTGRATHSWWTWPTTTRSGVSPAPASSSVTRRTSPSG